ncbi:eukaryotic-like serine/threonine-protein kinase [Azospirillaceae bacterium]
MKEADIKKLGKYDIVGELGKGAMGVVYKGKDPFIERAVAIKTVRTDMMAADDPEATSAQITRFKREAQAAGRINHPNIVAIYEYGEDGPTAFIAMEFISGRDLKDYFDKNERFDMKTVVRIMCETLSALEYAHKGGIVHRDIKPANIMMTAAGEVKITDFGIARLESSNLTQAGAVMGTPSYMSPEQFMGQQVDARSDLFSAGAVLYQFLTGEKPFAGSLTTIMHKVLNSQPEPPSLLNVSVPKGFDVVIAKAMAKRPEDRYQNAAEFAQAIRDAAEGRVSAPIASAAGDEEATIVDSRGLARAETRSASRSTEAVGEKSAKKGSSLGVIIGAVVVLAGGGAWWFLNNKPATSLAPVSTPPVVSTTSMVVAPTITTVPSTPTVSTSVAPTSVTPVAPISSTPVSPTLATPTSVIPVAPVSPTPVSPTSVAPTLATPIPVTPVAPVSPTSVSPSLATPAAPVMETPPKPPVLSTVNLAPVIGQLKTAFTRVECSILKVDSDHTGKLLISGNSGSPSAEAMIRQLVDNTAPRIPYALRLETISSGMCDPLGVINKFRQANLLSEKPVVLKPASPDGVFWNGQNLMLDLEAPDFPAYFQVDYFTLEGYVVHLFPNGLEKDNRLLSNGRRKLGDPAGGGRFWNIGAPFGRELITVIASARPLFPNLRPEAEQISVYLNELRKSLETVGRVGPTPLASAITIKTLPN